MRNQFINAIALATGKSEQEIAFMKQRDLVNELILPIIVQVTDQDIRGWRIHDDFMLLMAQFGEYCYREDPFTGEILLEIALQRLSCGAVLHESSSYDVLPRGYEKYSARCDQPGLFSDECWEFLSKQSAICFEANLTKDHIRKIVLGLIDHLEPNGDTRKHYSLGGMYFKTSGKTIYDWAWKTAKKEIPFATRYEAFAKPKEWERYISFFKENWKEINQDDFFERIGEKGFFNKRALKKNILA